MTGWPATLYVIQAADYSGAETAQAPLLAGDPDPLLACPRGSATDEWARSLGVRTVDLPFRTLRHSGGRRLLIRSLGAGLRSARDLRAIVRAHPERRLVYATSLRPAMLTGVAGFGLGRRPVWVMTDFLPPPPLRQAFQLLALGSGARLIAHSEALAADFAGGSSRLRDRVAVVHPGVEIERFAGVAVAARPPRAAVLGHVSPTKQTALALDIAARVRRERPDFGLDIAGSAQYRDEDYAYEAALRARVAGDPELAAHVTLHGRRPDIEAVFAGVSLLLHCRPDEPFGMALIEAMAAGLPVVAPDAAGPAEIVRHGETGLLYPPGDVEAAARHVLALLSDPVRARAMGAAGRRSAHERFDAATQLQLLRATLAELAA